MKQVTPFFLIVTDQDRKQFSVEGPLADDRAWIKGVAVAKAENRNVSCHRPAPGDRQNVTSAFKAQFPELEQVPSGSIVRF